jgi:Leucine-rich repeat (LRR) protein
MITDQDILLRISNAVETKKLDLSGLGITTIPEQVFELSDLRSLSLKSNLLTELPREICKLSNLRLLNLRSNRLQSLPSEIGNLTQLVQLNLSKNRFDKFPLEILTLTALQNLYLNRCPIHELPEEISNLINLKTLYLQRCQLSHLPESIVSLPLSDLHIDSNKIIGLPANISEFKQLRVLTAIKNNLEELPEGITKIKTLSNVKADKNPLRKPPIEVCGRGIKAIRQYFTDLKVQGEDYIYEAKLILVGEPAAGKTTLAEKLLNPDYKLNPTEPMTKGIEVKEWEFPYNNEISFRANVWDFGGQEIMHATHRYFLTERSLYLLVADNRKEDTDFYYWLKMIELFSSSSPVLIVLNEKHDYKKYVSTDILQSFACIKGVLSVNLSDNRGLSDLTKAIQQHITTLPHVGKEPIPRTWVKVRRDLEIENKDYISRASYLNICYQLGVENQIQALRISEFLHDLGVILHFQKDRLLRNTVILNTSWATEAVYMILFDEKIIKNNGRFDNTNLEELWSSPEYIDKHADLLQLMIKFELCYEIGHSQEYIIPQLLPEKPKDYTWNDKENLLFQYLYAFMPKGIISRLIVRMNRYIFDELQWKSGVVIKIDGAIAEIKEDYFQRILKIRIAGQDSSECLAIIRKELREIHESFEADDLVDEMVPCICIECKNSNRPHFYKYEVLKKYASKDKMIITCDKSIEDVSVRELLSGIIDEGMSNALQFLGNIRGTLFEQVVEKLLTLIYPSTNIERGRKLKEVSNEIEEEYEFDFIITNQRQREIIIVEVKGQYKDKKIKLGDYNTKNTVQWFFGRTFPFAKKVLPNPNNFTFKACYITSADFEDDALEFLESQNKSRLKSSLLDVFYGSTKLLELLNNYGLTNEVKDLKRYFSRR